MPYPYYIIQQAAPVQGEGDSDTTKPDKFMGTDPQKLQCFITVCIMVFDNKPQKFRNDHQHVSYSALFLSEIALLWRQPNLMAYHESLIQSNWAEFVAELNKLFGEPDLAQSSEHALQALTM